MLKPENARRKLGGITPNKTPKPRFARLKKLSKREAEAGYDLP